MYNIFEVNLYYFNNLIVKNNNWYFISYILSHLILLSDFIVSIFYCILYERGNIDDAIEKIDMIVNDDRIQESLYVGGRKTADEREWDKIKGKK